MKFKTLQRLRFYLLHCLKIKSPNFPWRSKEIGLFNNEWSFIDSASFAIPHATLAFSFKEEF